ncbi:hypothetical protein ACQ5SO_20415 [Rhodovulum sp. DZ06]|uniref:hypothetical protein n=1 Tax=Rhodovulum sp. DZ06 TaxID=3425126 RepID=UPI003D34785E
MAHADDMMMDRRSARIMRGAFTLGALALAGLALAACGSSGADRSAEWARGVTHLDAAPVVMRKVCGQAMVEGDMEAVDRMAGGGALTVKDPTSLMTRLSGAEEYRVYPIGSFMPSLPNGGEVQVGQGDRLVCAVIPNKGPRYLPPMSVRQAMSRAETAGLAEFQAFAAEHGASARPVTSSQRFGMDGGALGDHQFDLDGRRIGFSYSNRKGLVVLRLVTDTQPR